MLAVILQQAEEITKAQLMIFKRIVAGANVEFEVKDYLRMALEIEIEDFNNFVFECKEMELKYRLILDAIVMVGVEASSEEQIKLLALYCEALSISKSELQYLVTMGKAIIEMSSSGYIDAYEMQVESVLKKVFYGYICVLEEECIYSNSRITILHPSNPKDVTRDMLDRIKRANTPCILLVNVEVDLSVCEMKFEGKESVILESCKFTGGNKNSVEFRDCKQVVIKNTNFTGFKTRTLVVEDIKDLEIERCKFENCRYLYDCNCWDYEEYELGAVIYSSQPTNIGNLSLKSCVFTKCGGENDWDSSASAFICNIKSNVNSCQFIECYNISYIWRSRDSTMFTDTSNGVNNIFQNSAKFN
jgi:hypothetical protein